MNRWSTLCGLGILGVALLVGAGSTQDTKKEEKKEDKKAKGFLPAGFKDLNLSASQKERVYTVLGDYKGKISSLEKQIAELKKQQQQEVFKVLTDEQKEKYLKSKGLEGKEKKDKTGE